MQKGFIAITAFTIISVLLVFQTGRAEEDCSFSAVENRLIFKTSGTVMLTQERIQAAMDACKQKKAKEKEFNLHMSSTAGEKTHIERTRTTNTFTLESKKFEMKSLPCPDHQSSCNEMSFELSKDMHNSKALPKTIFPSSKEIAEQLEKDGCNIEHKISFRDDGFYSIKEALVKSTNCRQVKNQSSCLEGEKMLIMGSNLNTYYLCKSKIKPEETISKQAPADAPVASDSMR